MSGIDRIGHTRTAALGPIAGCVEALGGCPGEVFRFAGLPMEILDYPDLPLRLADHYRLLREAARHTGEENFGAVLGQQVQTLSLSSYGHHVMSAPTLANCIARAGKELNRMMQTNTDLVLWPVGTHMCWSMIFHTPGHAGRYQNELLAVSYLLNSLRGYLGADWRPDLIRIIDQDYSRTRKLEQLFNAPVRCGYEACGIEFDPKLMATSRAIDDSPAATGTTADMPTGGPACLSTIRAATQIAVLSGAPNVTNIASRLGMSRRSLQRRLTDHGTTASALVGTLKYERAKTLLAGSSHSIAMIADQLGYSDPAHFNRAFRAWAGFSPRDYRAIQSK